MKKKHSVAITTTLLALGLMSASSRADKKQDQQKFCSAATTLNEDITRLNTLTGNSTVREVKIVTNKLRQDANTTMKAARKLKTPAATQFTQSAQQLVTETRNLPENMRVSQVLSRLEGDANNVRQSGHALAAESGCPEAIPQQGETGQQQAPEQQAAPQGQQQQTSPQQQQQTSPEQQQQQRNPRQQTSPQTGGGGMTPPS